MNALLPRKLAMMAIASTLFTCNLATAQATGGPSSGEGTPPQVGKPPEKAAIDACVGKAEGDRVYFTDSKGKKRHWACAMSDGQLAARSGVATPARPKK